MKNKTPILEPYHDLLEKYLALGVNLSALYKIISPEIAKDGKKITYGGMKYHILNTNSLKSFVEVKSRAKR
jgi:hypothetical protein